MNLIICLISLLLLAELRHGDSISEQPQFDPNGKYFELETNFDSGIIWEDLSLAMRFIIINKIM